MKAIIEVLKDIFLVIFFTALTFLIVEVISPNTIIAKADAGTYSTAKKYIGLHENKHRSRLKKILGVNPAVTPWCGAFVKIVHRRSGKAVPKGPLRSINWLTRGKKVTLKRARKGDIVVIRTSYGHHVGIFAGFAGNGRIKLLGGNQSNRVKFSNFKIRSVIGVRRY